MFEHIKSTLKNLGFTALAVLAFIQIWDWWNAPSDSLVAQVEFGPFYLPPLVDIQFEKFRELGDSDKLSRSIDLEKVLEDNRSSSRVFEKLLEDLNPQSIEIERKRIQDLYDRESSFLAGRIVGEIAGLLRETFPWSFSSEITQISGFWSVRIENAGPTSLSDVTIVLPNTVYISLNREGNNTQNRESREVVSIGDLRPREVVRLIAWSTYGPALLFTDDIKLTHAKGLGEISIRAPAGAFVRWIENYWGLLIIMIVTLSPIVFLLGVAVADVMRKHTVGTKETAETDQDGKSDGTKKDTPASSPDSKPGT